MRSGSAAGGRALTRSVIQRCRQQAGSAAPSSSTGLVVDQHMLGVAVTQPATTPNFQINLLSMAEDVGRASQLSGVVEDFGYSCTANEAAFKDVVQQVSTINETAVADLFSMMARTDAKLADTHSTQTSVAAALGAIGLTSAPASQHWDLEVVVKVLKSSYPSLRWQSVPDHYDRPTFSLPSHSAFQTLIKAYKQGSKEAFPLQAVVGRVWQNQQGQVEFLKHAIESPPEVFTFEHAIRQQPPLEGLVVPGLDGGPVPPC